MVQTFDNIMSQLLGRKFLKTDAIKHAIKVVVKAFDDEDNCDLEDSAYFEHEEVQAALKELHPVVKGA